MPEAGFFPTIKQDRKSFFWLFGLSALFIIANIIFISFRIYVFSILPLALLLILLAFISLEKVLIVIVFFTPLSIQLKEFYPDLGMNLYLPTEPLLFLVLVLFIIKILLEGNYPKEILKHPVTIAVLFYIIWIFITSVSSTMPLVSFKFLLTRIWFVFGFYFLGVLFFRNPKNFSHFFTAYISGMLLVVIFALINHGQEGFVNQQAAHGAPNPFFSDHTSYGAVLGMFLPIIIGLAFRSDISKINRTGAWVLTIIFLGALVLSYSRAAWISVILTLLIFVLLKLKVRFSILLFISTLTLLFIVFYWSEILMKLEENRQDSSTDMAQHVQSISNISSDASNLERINRWKSAIRMFREKPLLGWGPGTYMFQYAAWQYSHEKTMISTNFGDRGNAHSEYIGPMAESGIFGVLSYIMILITVLYTGFNNYTRKRMSRYRWLSLVVSLGLITYVLHGFLNNFLDTDKVSIPFWGFIGLLVALDIYYKDTELKANGVKKEVLE